MLTEDKLRLDTNAWPLPDNCIPDSFHVLLQLLFGAQRFLEGETAEENEAEAKCKMLSIA